MTRTTSWWTPKRRLRPIKLGSWLPAVVVMVLLLGVGLQQHLLHRPTDWADYHERCQVAVASLPAQVNGPTGHWMAEERPIPQPAWDLLRPNAVRHLRYTDYSADALLTGARRVSLLVVQCRQARDMLGHYPPQCYPAHGSQLVLEQPRVWEVPDPASPNGVLRITGTEYHFVDPDSRGFTPVIDRSGQDRAANAALATWDTLAAAGWMGSLLPAPPGQRTTHPGEGGVRVVLNFLIVPGDGEALSGQIVPDMKGVEQAAEDYQQRRRGAAQVQLVFDPGVSPPEQEARDQILVDLLTPAVPAIRTLLGLPPSSTGAR